MTMPIQDNHKDLPERIRAEIQRYKQVPDGGVNIDGETIQGDALEALHEAIIEGVPVKLRGWIVGNLDFTRCPSVAVDDMEGLSPVLKEELKSRGVIEAPLVKAPVVIGWASINGEVRAEGVVFPRVDFRGTTFGDWADFRFATFGDGAVFWDATFGDGADFGQTTFAKGTSFGSAAFGDGADFEQATFGAEATFWDATFGGGADFVSATFEGKVDFWDATFGDGADFRSATFKGSAVFRGQRRREDEEEKPVFSGEAFLQSVDFELPEKVIFQHANLSKARFLHTHMEKVRFIDVDWYKPEGNGRRGLYDEEFAEEEGYELVRQLYLQLKKNYEEARDYPGAGDFHYGEMEMTLKQQELEWKEEQKKWPKFKKWFAWFLTRSYKFLSGYGEKVDRAIVIALAILLAGVPFYFFDKLTLVTPQGIWSAFWDGLVASMGYMTFRLSQPPTVLWAKPVMAIQAILGPIQLALTALALRRRFRR